MVSRVETVDDHEPAPVVELPAHPSHRRPAGRHGEVVGIESKHRKRIARKQLERLIDLVEALLRQSVEAVGRVEPVSMPDIAAAPAHMVLMVPGLVRHVPHPRLKSAKC